MSDLYNTQNIQEATFIESPHEIKGAVYVQNECDWMV